MEVYYFILLGYGTMGALLPHFSMSRDTIPATFSFLVFFSPKVWKRNFHNISNRFLIEIQWKYEEKKSPNQKCGSRHPIVPSPINDSPPLKSTLFFPKIGLKYKKINLLKFRAKCKKKLPLRLVKVPPLTLQYASIYHRSSTFIPKKSILVISEVLKVGKISYFTPLKAI